MAEALPGSIDIQLSPPGELEPAMSTTNPTAIAPSTSAAPPQARINGQDIHVDNVDLHRASRNLGKLLSNPGYTPPKDAVEMMELMARVMGYPNMRELYVQGASQEALLKEVTRNTPPAPPVYGKRQWPEPEYKVLESFPKDLPEQFDAKWKTVTSIALQRSVNRINVARGDVVVVLGKEGTGKSILGRTFARDAAGVLIDAEMPNWELQLVPFENGEKPRLMVWRGAETVEGGLATAAHYIQGKTCHMVVLLPSTRDIAKLADAMEAAGAQPGAMVHIVDVAGLRCFDAPVLKSEREKRANAAHKPSSRRAAP